MSAALTFSRDEVAEMPPLTADRVLSGRWVSAESAAIYLRLTATQAKRTFKRKGFPRPEWEHHGEPMWDIQALSIWSCLNPITDRPSREPTCLYRHFDAKGRLLYVGISLSATKRTGQHKCGSHWFRDVASITLEWFDTREDAASAELRAIESEKPLHNKAGVK